MVTVEERVKEIVSEWANHWELAEDYPDVLEDLYFRISTFFEKNV